MNLEPATLAALGLLALCALLPGPSEAADPDPGLARAAAAARAASRIR